MAAISFQLSGKPIPSNTSFVYDSPISELSLVIAVFNKFKKFS